MNNKKTITLIILVLLSNLTIIYATDGNDTPLTDQIIDRIDSLKNKITSNPTVDEEYNVHSYNELIDTIHKLNKKEDNKTYKINLENGDYNITEEVTYGRVVNTNQHLIINGNGHTIDGQNKFKFLYLDDVNLTLENTVIQNTVSNAKKQAGVIEMLSPSDLNIENCTFINNKGDEKGSVVANRGNTNITNSIFINNTVTKLGGAIWSTGQYNGSLNIINSTFDNNQANIEQNHERTAIIYIVSGGSNSIKQNTFINNEGRCIHCFNNTNANISENNFKNNTLEYDDVIRGGVIDNYESDITITTNVFDNDKSIGELRGGILYHEIGKLIFTNNTVNNEHIANQVTSTASCSKGGVIFNRNSTAIISDNNFNNKMIGNLSRGAIIYNNMGNVTLENNNFKNTIEGNQIQGLVGYTDVAGSITSKNNKFNAKLIGTSLKDPDSDENIYNSNQKMTESQNTRGTVIYE